MVVAFQGLGFYTLRGLEASEVAGIWGNSCHLRSVNIMVLIQTLTQGYSHPVGGRATFTNHAHEPRSP